MHVPKVFHRVEIGQVCVKLV